MQHTTNLNDTIVALATPNGAGAIGVIRLSGKEAITIADIVFFGKKLINQPTHTLHFGTVREGGRILDEVVVSLFKGPRSYTGEDVVEISCHGSPYILQEVIQLLVDKGARMAQPGEFTMRAFLNGKMDLSQAEAVADLIASQSAASHDIAMQQMRGGFSNEIKELRQQLIDFASLIELELDFSEEDVEFANRDELYALVSKLQRLMRALIDSFRFGNVIKQGVNTVIAGRPNAGKSTLLNALLNEDRAIVSDIAGTTRDVIEEVLNINGIQFRIIDTAGIRDAEDTIEAMGVERTLEKVRQSSLLLYVFDVVQMQPEDVRADLERLVQPGIEVLVIANKMDLNPWTKWEQYFVSSSPGPSSRGGEIQRVADGDCVDSQKEIQRVADGDCVDPQKEIQRVADGDCLEDDQNPEKEAQGVDEDSSLIGLKESLVKTGMWETANPQAYRVLKEKARELRKNQTEAEKYLWERIRRRQIDNFEFRRQHIVGPFIPDFLCLERKLIIEVDGGYHQSPEVVLKDEQRTAILEEAGYRVLRFENEEVLEKTEQVIEAIRNALQLPLLPVKESKADIEEQIPLVPKENWIPIVAKEGMNIPYLKEKLHEAVINEKVNLDDTVVTNIRHYEALRKADEALNDVLKGMDSGVTSDFIAMDIRQSLYHLGEITGEISTDDLLGNIFSNFCIGK